jgi:hypothetical protein
MMVIVGTDPGGAHTALVARDGARLVEALYRERHPAATRLDWLVDCAIAAKAMAARVDATVAGVEDVEAPNPHVGRKRRDGSDRGARIINPGPAIEAALCAGALVTALREVCPVRLVKPGGFGAPQPNRRMLLAVYPVELVGPRETTGSGKSKWQHLRSAWDVAGATARWARQQKFLPAYRGG